MKVCIRTVGCRTNQADTLEMIRTLTAAGVEVVADTEAADWVLVNSCTVTMAADRDTRREAYRARRGGRSPRVIVTGCMPAALGTDAPWADEETLLMPDRGAAVAMVIAAAGEVRPLDGPPHDVTRRHYIKIQEGCDQRCRYCIVPDARGHARSVPVEEVLDAARRAAAEGRRDVVLTGTHVGRWGEDLEPRRDLAYLVGRIATQARPGTRYRLGSLEPQDCSPGIMDVLAEPALCPHLHLPLQGGADSLLRRMGRPYRTARFRDLVEEARARLGPLLCISADVIAGFPGENEEEFRQTLGFISSLDLSYLHVFTYSPRPGTPAAGDPDQVPANIAKARTRELRDLGEEKRAAFARSMVGRRLEVFVEAVADEQGWVTGLTDNALRATIRGEVPPGHWCSATILGEDRGILTGAAVDLGVCSPND